MTTSEKQNAPEREPRGAHEKARANSTRGRRLSPRQARVIDALRAGRWIPRWEVDQIARASNGPDIIARLRNRLGDDAIETRIVERTDSDGRSCWPGEYRLTGTGFLRLQEADYRAGH